MKRNITIASACLLLLILLTACGSKPLTPDQQKALINNGIDTLVRAMAVYNPTWNTGPILQHKAQAINDWNSGAGWQTKEVADLELIVNDIEGMTGCDQQCQAATLVAEGGVTTVIVILEGQTGSSAQTVTASATSAPKARAARASRPVPTYKNYAEYRAAWNKAAPASAQLK